MATRLHPFDAACEHLAPLTADGRKWKWIEVASKSKIYELLNNHVPSNLIDEDDAEYPDACKQLAASEAWAQSFKADVVPGAKKKKLGWSTYDDDVEDDEGTCAKTCKRSTFNRVALRSGFGLFAFRDTHRRPVLGLHQRLGDPVGTNCGADHMTNWVLFTSGKVSELAEFLSELVEESERAREGVFPCFGWHIKYQYWKKETSCRARPLSSVVLPPVTKDKLVTDIQHFLSPETSAFYLQHGIPYRRSYLFYGLPGTGKTSLVQALAGHFKRSVCFLQPTHPDMTDDSLRAAMIQVPEDSIVVLEDIDSLFDKERANKVGKSSLTFSGLLNALDGIGSPNGQIFILTTNLREQLDAALIRNGRVDIQVEFAHATEEQVLAIWSSFYPAAAHLAPAFHTALRRSLDGRPIVTSALQHFFVQQMRSTADEALAAVGAIVEDLKAKDVEEAARKAAGSDKEGGKKKKGGSAPGTPEKDGKKEKKKAGNAAGSSASGSGSSSRGGKAGVTEIHVHVHTAAPADVKKQDDDSDDDSEASGSDSDE